MAEKQSVHQKSYICLFDGAAFVGYKLYPSAQARLERTDPLFDIPVYVDDGKPGYVNYLLLEVKVCPKCYFACNDDQYFQTSSAFAKPLELDSDVVAVVKQQEKERREIGRSAPTLFSRERSLADAVVAYKLGIASSKAIYDVAPRQYSVEAVRMANYALKAAKLLEGHNAAERETWLRLAKELLEQASAADLKGGLLAKTLYQWLALSLHLGEDATASRVFESLRKLQDRSALAYVNRGRQLWEDREQFRRKG